MADAAGRFRGKLEELCAMGRRNGMRLSAGRIRDVLREDELTESQLQLVYSYLDQMAITVFEPDTGGEPDEGGGERRSLEVYLEELDRITPLPGDMEYLLFEKAAGGDRDAAGALIERYLQTVCDLASEYESNYPKLDVEDIVQEANTGLVLGVQALEKEETLAAYRARLLNSVTRHLEEELKSLEEMMTSDERVVNRMNQLAGTIRELEEELGHKPSVEELSAFLELPSDDIRDLLRVGGGDLKVSEP